MGELVEAAGQHVCEPGDAGRDRGREPVTADAIRVAEQRIDQRDGQQPLTSPISARIAGFADILSGGFDMLPDYALEFMIVGAVVGIAITFGETFWKYGRKWLPSATGLGIGMMVPGFVVFTMVLGGILMKLWTRYHRNSADKLAMPLASGLIAGEAVMAIVIPVLIALKVIAP